MSFFDLGCGGSCHGGSCGAKTGWGLSTSTSSCSTLSFWPISNNCQWIPVTDFPIDSFQQLQQYALAITLHHTSPIQTQTVITPSHLTPGLECATVLKSPVVFTPNGRSAKPLWMFIAHLDPFRWPHVAHRLVPFSRVNHPPTWWFIGACPRMGHPKIQWFFHGFSTIRSAVSGIYRPFLPKYCVCYLHKMVGHGGLFFPIFPYFLIIFLSQRGFHFQGQLPFRRVRFPRRSHGCCNDGIDPDFEAKQKKRQQWPVKCYRRRS